MAAIEEAIRLPKIEMIFDCNAVWLNWRAQ